MFVFSLSNAQYKKPVVKYIPIPKEGVQQNTTTVTKTDTVNISSSKITQKSKQLIASNLPANSKNKLDTAKGYSHVPLAGEKSYFGEKTDFVNDFVRKYMELHNRTLSSVQSNSATPFSVIDDVLEQKNMPKELKYLAVIESALNHTAVSHAGAVGPWQLMETTARMMGLTVNRKKDERTDWYKSTNAATKYLDLLYSQLNDWLLVIAAYNSGPTPVQRAIDLTGSHNFWDIKEYLPRETQGHVLAFIATASIFENLSKFINLGSVPLDFNFGKDEEPLPVENFEKPGTTTTKIPTAGVTGTTTKKGAFTEEEMKNMVIIPINEPIVLDLLAQEINADKKQLQQWNADYDLFLYKKYQSPIYNLHIPKEKLDIFLQKKQMLTKKSKSYLEQK